MKTALGAANHGRVILIAERFSCRRHMMGTISPGRACRRENKRWSIRDKRKR